MSLARVVIFVLALGVDFAAVSAALRRLRVVRRWSGVEAQRLRRRLGAAPLSGWSEVLASSPGDTVAGRVVAEILAEPLGAARVSALGERMRELGAALAQGARVPGVAARAALTAGLGLALARLGATSGTSGGPDLPLALVVFVMGGSAGALALGLGRHAESLADQARRDWDALLGFVARRLDEQKREQR